MKIDEQLIDAEALQPGDVIEPDEVERLIGINRESDPMGYQLGLLQLQNVVTRLLHKLGKIYTVTCDAKQINVLTHSEASRYNSGRFGSAMASMRRCHKRLVAVDVSKLEAIERESHDRAIVKQSRVLLGIKLTRGEPVPTVVVAKDPARITRAKSFKEPIT